VSCKIRAKRISEVSGNRQAEDSIRLREYASLLLTALQCMLFSAKTATSNKKYCAQLNSQTKHGVSKARNQKGVLMGRVSVETDFT